MRVPHLRRAVAGSPGRPSAAATASAVAAHVADHAERAGRVGAEGLGVEVDLHDDGAVGDQPAVPHRPHVQGAAPADDQVGAADQLGGQRRGEPAGDVQRPRAAGEQSLRHRRRGQQRAGTRSASCLQRGPAPGPASAAAGHEHRPRARRARRGASASRRTPSGVDRRSGRRRRPRAGLASAALGCGLHVSGRFSRTVRAVAAPRSPRRRAASATAVAAEVDSARHGAPPPAASARLVDEKFDRGWVASAATTTSGVRLLAASVMPVIALVSPQPWCTVTAADPAAHPGVGVGHRRRAALVPGGDVTGARRDQRVGDVEVAGADDAEDGVDPGRGRAPVRPTSATVIRRSTSASTRDRAAGAADDRQRAGDQHRAGRRQLRQVLQLGQAVLAVAEQERVARERRVEGVRGAGVGADRLHARRPMHRRLLGQPPRALAATCPGCAGRCRRR